MAAQLYAEAEEADRVVGETQGCVPTVYQPTGRTGGRIDQPNPPRVGELLCGGSLEPMLFVCQRLGREEGQAAFDACPEAEGLRLEEME